MATEKPSPTLINIPSENITSTFDGQAWLKKHAKEADGLKKVLGPELYNQGTIAFLPLSTNSTTLIYTENVGEDDELKFKGGSGGEHRLTIQQTKLIKFAPGTKKPNTEFTVIDENNSASELKSGAMIHKSSIAVRGVGTIPVIGFISTVNHSTGIFQHQTDGVMIWMNGSFSPTAYNQESPQAT